MGEKIEINSQEELKKFLEKLKDQTDLTSEELTKLAEAVKEKFGKEPEELIAMRDQLAKQEQQIEQLIGKMETVVIATKARGTWKEGDTPMAKAYGIGKFTNLLLQGYNKSSPIAGRELLKMGGQPVREVEDQIVKIPISGNFEKSSPAYTDNPLASDDAATYYGAYLIPVEYGAELGRIAADASAMMGLVTHMPMRGITKYLPRTVDALTFTAVTDQQPGTKTEDTLSFERATLTAITYAFYLAISEEMDEDSLIGIGELVRTMAGEAWGMKFDDLALDNSTYGALHATSVNNLVMDSGDVSHSDLDINYLDNLIAELTTQNKRQGARYFFSPTVFDYIRQEKDAQGRYIFQDAVNAAPATIRGYPFTISDGMPPSSESAASDPFVLFGNPRYIVAGDRVGFEFKVFADTMGAAMYDQIYLRVRVRQAMITWMPTAMAKLTTAAS
ncbi:MAG TPA: phage major capsid protein [Anaerolineales bacterium]|nr:phage major capsid protein [Anaerolineales bacterium]